MVALSDTKENNLRSIDLRNEKEEEGERFDVGKNAE